MDALCQSLIHGSSPSRSPPLQLRILRRRQVGTRGQFFPVLRFNMDAHLQGAAALHAPVSYKQHMDLISLILGCRRVIMFLCASRLPSFAPGHRPLHGSRSQVTAGLVRAASDLNSRAHSRLRLRSPLNLKYRHGRHTDPTYDSRDGLPPLSTHNPIQSQICCII